MKGLTELLMMKHKPGGSDHELLQRLCYAGDRGVKLIKQIMTYSQTTPPEKKPVSIASIIEESLQLLHSKENNP